MKFNLHTSLIALLSITIVLLLAYGAAGSKEKTAYISIGKIYDSFQLTKELNAQFESVKNNRQSILDSLYVQLSNYDKGYAAQSLSKEQLQRYEQLRQVYYRKQQAFDQDNEALMGKYNKQIMNRLNQYVEDYGKKYGYTYIYGANGNGALMFADEGMDISDKMTDYINERYQGK